MHEYSKEPYQVSINIIPFCRWEHWGSKKLDSYLKVSQPVSSSTEIVMQVIWLQSHCSSPLHYLTQVGWEQGGREDGTRKGGKKGGWEQEKEIEKNVKGSNYLTHVAKWQITSLNGQFWHSAHMTWEYYCESKECYLAHVRQLEEGKL